MPRIPDAFSDATPAAAVYRDRLYIAYKDQSSQHIWLASTDNPDDNTSWRRTELTMSFSGAGPGMIHTLTGPALSVVGDRLWLAFKGHNNNRIWLVSTDGVSYRGHGSIPDARTAEAPSLAGPLIVHRGDADRRIWYKILETPGGDNRIPYESASTFARPAVATRADGHPVVAFRSADGNDIMATALIGGPGRTEWTVPARIVDAQSLYAPALARHENSVFVAYHSSTNDQVRIASFDPHPWTYHDVAPGFYAGAPALVSFGGRLYIVGRWNTDNNIWYWEIDTERFHHAVEIGYLPNPNGFRFLNFSEGAPDWSTFRDTFGHAEIDAAATGAFFDHAFAMFTGGLYALLFDNFFAVYQGFTNGTFNTGMCSAYAAASLRRYWEGTSPALYGENMGVDAAAELPAGIRRELTVDFGRLLGGETLTDLLAQCEAEQANVGQTLRDVHRELQTGSGLRTGRIVFFVPSGRIWDAGFLDHLAQTHAVVPYRIEYPVTSNGQPIRMYVYDCNHPGNNDHSYIEFTPDGHGGYTFALYTGDHSSSLSDLTSANGFTLASMTLQDYLFRDISLPFRLDFVVDLLNSPAELRVHDGHGRLTGRMGGHVHWQIPGSYPLYPSARGFLLPRGTYSREIQGTGDGEYTFTSLSPDGTGVLIHGLARGGGRPSRDTVNIDVAGRTVAIRSERGPQHCTVALSRPAAGGIRLVSFSNVRLEEKVPLTLAYSEMLDAVRGTYEGPAHDVVAEAFHSHRAAGARYRVQAQRTLERGKPLQLRLHYDPEIAIED